MTYDTDTVDALLKAMELHFNPKSLVPELREAWQALKPQPEMEHVLGEDVPIVFTEMINEVYRAGQQNLPCTPWRKWELLREATRRPKADKVSVIPSGADWSYEDRLNIWESVKKFPGTEAITYVIDHIKSKCGV